MKINKLGLLERSMELTMQQLDKLEKGTSDFRTSDHVQKHVGRVVGMLNAAISMHKIGASQHKLLGLPVPEPINLKKML